MAFTIGNLPQAQGSALQQLFNGTGNNVSSTTGGNMGSRSPDWQINTGSSYYDPGSEQWVTENKIADWAKPYVHDDGSYKSYNELKSAGMWDPTNANMQRYFDALSNTGSSNMRKSGSAGDWRTNLGARNTLFSRLGLTTADVLRNPVLGFGDPREAFGDFFDAGSYGGVEAARAAQVKASEGRGGLGGIIDTGVDFVKDWGKEFVIPAALTYVGVNALGGALGGAEGAAAAGAEGAAGGAGGTEVLGSGITQGAGGVTGITQGAGGASGIAGVAPAGTPLAQGYFGSEAAGLAAAPTIGVPSNPSGSPVTAPVSGSTLATLANAIPAVAGLIGANQQANDYQDVANQYMAMGAPYRSKLSELYSDPEGYLNSAEVLIPVQNATNILARSLSTKGNPIGSGNALQQLQNYAAEQLYSRLGQEKDRLAGFGGLTSYNQAAPGAASTAIESKMPFYTALGGIGADIFSSGGALNDLYNKFRRQGILIE